MIGKILRNATGIRDGEESRAVVMFLYIFLIISSLLIVKPVSNSMFIARFGSSSLPYVYLLVALLAGFVTWWYSRSVNRVRFERLIVGTLFLSIAIFAVFLRVFHGPNPPGWLIYAFYAWVQIFGVLATTQFWLLANHVFNSREAKRLFGFIGAGAISGGIFGGYLTRWLVPVFGTVHMIIFCISFLLINVFLLRLAWIRAARSRVRQRIEETPEEESEDQENRPGKIVLSSPYLRLVAGIVGLSVVVATLVEYQFSTIASHAIQDRDALTGFFGFWLSNLSILSLLIQLFLTGKILARLGVGTSLFFLPLAILGGAFGIFIYPGLWSAVMIKVADGGFKQSVNKAGIELLYLPLPSRIKAQAKAFIDVFVDSFASGLGGLLLILCTIIFGMHPRAISLVIIGLIALWMILLVMIRKEYVNAFRLALEQRSIDPAEPSVNPEQSATFEYLTGILRKGSHRNILYVLSLIETTRNPKWLAHLVPLLQHWSADVRARALELLPNYQRQDFTEMVKPLAEDPDDEVRFLAIQYLYRQSSDRIQALQNFLQNDHMELRLTALLVAAMEGRDSSQFRKRFPLESAYHSLMDEIQKTEDLPSKNRLKIYAARIAGAAGYPRLYGYLHVMLNDKSNDVLQAAIEAAGATQAQEFVPLLIRKLDRAGVRKIAREALASYKELALDDLLRRLTDPQERKSIRMRIPGVIARIGIQRSMDSLVAVLDQRDLFLRFEIIKALNKLRTNFPGLKVDGDRITRKILDETKNYYQIFGVLNAESRQAEHDEPVGISHARRLLMRALDEKLEANLERIFRLLGLKYPPRDIFNAYRGIVSRRDDQRANAVEFLDNLLDAGLKRYILPIVETRQAEAMIERLAEEETDWPRENTLMSLLDGDDTWLQVCALHLLAQQKDVSAASTMAKLVNSPDAVVRETAAYALRAIEFPLN